MIVRMVAVPLCREETRAHPSFALLYCVTQKRMREESFLARCTRVASPPPDNLLILLLIAIKRLLEYRAVINIRGDFHPAARRTIDSMVVESFYYFVDSALFFLFETLAFP